MSSVVLALVFVFELVLFPSAIFAKNMGSGGADEMGSVGNVSRLLYDRVQGMLSRVPCARG